MKLYYHKTDGGAEYLCSEKVEGTNEGSLKSAYIVRIDGDIRKDAEIFIKSERMNKISNILRFIRFPLLMVYAFWVNHYLDLTHYLINAGWVIALMFISEYSNEKPKGRKVVKK